jgi:hypothetical protein
MKVKRRFGGIYCLHFQGGRLGEARTQYEAGSKQITGEYVKELAQRIHKTFKWAEPEPERLSETQWSEIK